MKCPRCDSEAVGIMATAPVGQAWEVYLCDTCQFSWRSTEGDNITDPDQYDPRFKLNPKDFDKLTQMPPIPPLLKK